jgi:hypothetical protein
MADPDLAQIAAQFAGFSVEKSRSGYVILDRRTQADIARLRPFTGSDRLELLYWSAIRNRWRTFGNLGPMRLTIQEAHEIVIRDPIFQIPRAP